MKVAFNGKGGSGKTTLSSLFIRQAVDDSLPVLALDADINQHLASALGVSKRLVSMGEQNDSIKEYLRGTNTRFTTDEMHKTTPPGHGSQLLRLQDTDWFIQNFALKQDGVYVAGAGEIPEGNIGVKCYHGLNGSIELVLGHFIDADDEFVVVDMTAGADAFSSSLFTKVDALVLVVEPTIKSLSVYDQFLPHTKEYGIPLFVVGNKIESADDRAFIEDKTGKLAAEFGVSQFVKKKERGQAKAEDRHEASITVALRELRTALLKGAAKDWPTAEQRSYAMHRKNADSWMGEAAHDHIDTEFSLQQAANAILASR